MAHQYDPQARAYAKFCDAGFSHAQALALVKLPNPRTAEERMVNGKIAMRCSAAGLAKHKKGEWPDWIREQA